MPENDLDVPTDQRLNLIRNVGELVVVGRADHQDVDVTRGTKVGAARARPEDDSHVDPVDHPRPNPRSWMRPRGCIFCSPSEGHQMS